MCEVCEGRGEWEKVRRDRPTSISGYLIPCFSPEQDTQTDI